MRLGFHTLLLLSCLLSASSCYRYSLPPEAEAEITKAQAIKAEGRWDEFCKTVMEVRAISPDSLIASAQCKRYGWADSAPDIQSAAADLRQAAACGATRANELLSEMGEPLVNVGEGPGETILGRGESKQCGFKEEITTTGWIVAPVAVPLGIVFYFFYGLGQLLRALHLG